MRDGEYQMTTYADGSIRLAPLPALRRITPALPEFPRAGVAAMVLTGATRIQVMVMYDRAKRMLCCERLDTGARWGIDYSADATALAKLLDDNADREAMWWSRLAMLVESEVV